LRLVDMPGWDSGFEGHSQAIDSYARRSLAYGVVVSAEEGNLRESMRNVLAQLMAVSPCSRLVVIITKTDKKTRQDVMDVTCLVEKEVYAATNHKPFGVVSVSSRTGNVSAFIDILHELDKQAESIFFDQVTRVFVENLSKVIDRACILVPPESVINVGDMRRLVDYLLNKYQPESDKGKKIEALLESLVCEISDLHEILDEQESQNGKKASHGAPFEDRVRRNKLTGISLSKPRDVIAIDRPTPWKIHMTRFGRAVIFATSGDDDVKAVVATLGGGRHDVEFKFDVHHSDSRVAVDASGDVVGMFGWNDGWLKSHDRYLRIMDIRRGTRVWQSKHKSDMDDTPYCLAPSPDGRFWVRQLDYSSKRLSILSSKGRSNVSMKSEFKLVTPAFSADSSRLYVATSNGNHHECELSVISLVDASIVDEIPLAVRSSFMLSNVAADLAGKHCVVFSCSDSVLVDLETRSSSTLGFGAEAMCLSPQGDMLVALHLDGLKFYSISNGAAVLVSELHDKQAYSSSGRLDQGFVSFDEHGSCVYYTFLGDEHDGVRRVDVDIKYS